MGSREFEWDINNTCDDCGEPGAYDIYGDFVCSECLSKLTVFHIEGECSGTED